MSEKKASLIPGIILIVLGLWFLVRRFPYLSDYSFQIYPILLILFSIFLFVEAARRHHNGALFWGSVILVIGGFFCLRNYGIIPYFYADEYWPIFLVALGIGFIAMFIYHPNDWGLIIPAALFLFFGVVFSLRTFHGYFWHWADLITDYWPVVLIIIGVGVFLGAFRHRSNPIEDRN